MHSFYQKPLFCHLQAPVLISWIYQEETMQVNFQRRRTFLSYRIMRFLMCTLAKSNFYFVTCDFLSVGSKQIKRIKYHVNMNSWESSEYSILLEQHFKLSYILMLKLKNIGSFCFLICCFIVDILCIYTAVLEVWDISFFQWAYWLRFTIHATLGQSASSKFVSPYQS